MPIRILYSRNSGVEEDIFLDKDELVQHLRRLDVHKNTIITLCDMRTFKYTFGTKKILINVLSKVDDVDDLFNK